MDISPFLLISAQIIPANWCRVEVGNDAKMNIDMFTVTSDNEHVTAFWLNSYTLITRANSHISKY